MIKHCGSKGTGYVTEAAILVCYNMTIIFTGRIDTVMTVITPLAQHFRAGMVDKCIGEINSVMACTSILGSVLMSYCIRCPSGSNHNIIHTAVMTGGAIIGDARVGKN